MTRSFLMMTAILAIAATPATAAAPAKKASAPPPASTSIGPKQVTRAEYLGDFQARFNAMDANHDGVITVQEVQAAQAAARKR